MNYVYKLILIEKIYIKIKLNMFNLYNIYFMYFNISGV